MTMKSYRILYLLVISACLLTMSANGFALEGHPTTEPTTVEVAVVVLDLERIDDAIQEFYANVFFVARWNDPRVSHDGRKVERRDLSDIWHPRLNLVNRRHVTITLPETVEITPDGTVTYRQRVLGQFSQRLDLADFPLDKQTLAIQLVAVGYSQEEVVFQEHSEIPSDIAPDLSISDWQVLGSRVEIRGYQPMPGVRQAPSFVFEFDAKRKVGYYTSKIILPLLLIVAMSWLVFWIDPELAAPQISIAVTSMLTLIAYRFMVGGMLPRISYLTRIDVFTTASTILVFLTLIEATLTVMLTKRQQFEKARTIDRISRWGFPLCYVAVFVWSFLL